LDCRELQLQVFYGVFGASGCRVLVRDVIYFALVIMTKGGGVAVEVSDDDDGDFQPLPLRLSQVSIGTQCGSCSPILCFPFGFEFLFTESTISANIPDNSAF